ncbi:MAG: hypothetical protein QM674_12255 [Burkholderiaceae bacterium]
MRLRIGVAGVEREPNTFAQGRADFREFVRADAWPGLSWRGDVPDAVAGLNVPAAGMLAVLDFHADPALPAANEAWMAAIRKASRY